MKKNVVLLLLCMYAMVAASQTADNEAVCMTWTLSEGTATPAVTFSPATTQAFIAKTSMTVGSELSVNGIATTTEGLKQTYFKQSKKGAASSDANAVCFQIEPQQGIAFTPTKVSFKAARWVTDTGNLDAVWVNGDGSTKTLVTGDRPNRDGTDANVSSYSYDITGTKASETTCYLKVNIYGLNSGKEISLGDVVVEGTLYGTVGQPLTYSVSVSADPAEGGTAQISPVAEKYESGSMVSLSQTTNDGYVFTGWYDAGGNILSSSSNYNMKVEGNATVTARYQTVESLLVADYVIIPANDITAFRNAIKAANENKTGKRQFIFLKNGTYDYGTYHNPESGFTPYGRDTVKVDNVSIIGQSTDGVTVQIEPEQASVSRTAPIVIRGTGTYLQDFTLKNNYSYGGNDGQAAALMDKGHHTIGKNMRLVSSQDTYYSNTDYGQLYFETSEFHGTVDYICGRGDVYFNRCDLICENRYPKQGENKGVTNVAAPYTIAENFNDAGGHGYIFNDCKIDCLSQTWDFGRGWRGYPKMAFLNTRLTESAALRLGTDQTKGKAVDYTLRVDVKSIQTSSDSHYMHFYEYNTMDAKGNVVSPASNVLTFTAYDNGTYETILKADETARFQLRNVYTDWMPDEECRQVRMSSVSREGNSLSWEVAEGDMAKAFLIECDGEFVDIVDGTTNVYDVTGKGTGKFTVRAANLMGGFGVALTEGTTALSTVKGQDAAGVVRKNYYNTAGMQMSQPSVGVNIEETTLSDGTVIRKKITK